MHQRLRPGSGFLVVDSRSPFCLRADWIGYSRRRIGQEKRGGAGSDVDRVRFLVVLSCLVDGMR